MSFAVEQDAVGLPTSAAAPPRPDEPRLNGLDLAPRPPAVSDRPPVFNLGYWGDGAVTAREAQLTFVRRLADRLPDLEGRRVLDTSHAAAGSAVVLALEYRARVDAINVPPEQAEGARAYVGMYGLEDEPRFHSVDPGALPFEESTFDVVFSLEAAHRLGDKRAFVREAYRVLRPGGVIVLSDMTATLDVPLARRLRSRGVDLMTGEAWRTMGQEAGFEILEHRLVGSAVYPGHRRWMMLTAAERRRAIRESLGPDRGAVPATIGKAQAWWLEFRTNRYGFSVAGALGLREYVLMLGRRPSS
jgi:cyclopropane fatty-acyl-phospholipid synthase-like methyltransferase